MDWDRNRISAHTSRSAVAGGQTKDTGSNPSGEGRRDRHLPCPMYSRGGHNHRASERCGMRTGHTDGVVDLEGLVALLEVDATEAVA